MANSSGSREGCPFCIYGSTIFELQDGDCSSCRELLVSSSYYGMSCDVCKLPFRTVKQSIPAELYFIVAYKVPKDIVDVVMATDGLVHVHTFTDMYFTSQTALETLNSSKFSPTIIYKVKTATDCDNKYCTIID